MRRNIFHDYYYPNATKEEADYSIVHLSKYPSNQVLAPRKELLIHQLTDAAHCVDTIRRSLMCKADVAIYTAYWIGDHTAVPSKELRSESDTVCVNWEAIDAWSRQRLLPKDKYKLKPGPFETRQHL